MCPYCSTSMSETRRHSLNNCTPFSEKDRSGKVSKNINNFTKQNLKQFIKLTPPPSGFLFYRGIYSAFLSSLSLYMDTIYSKIRRNTDYGQHEISKFNLQVLVHGPVEALRLARQSSTYGLGLHGWTPCSSLGGSRWNMSWYCTRLAIYEFL